MTGIQTQIKADASGFAQLPQVSIVRLQTRRWILMAQDDFKHFQLFSHNTECTLTRDHMIRGMATDPCGVFFVGDGGNNSQDVFLVILIRARTLAFAAISRVGTKFGVVEFLLTAEAGFEL